MTEKTHGSDEDNERSMPRQAGEDYDREYAADAQRERNLKNAAMLEIGIVYFYVIASVSRSYLEQAKGLDVNPSEAFILSIMQSSSLIPMAVLFMQMVIYILTRRGLITGLIIERYVPKYQEKIFKPIDFERPVETRLALYPDPIVFDFQRILDRSKQAYISSQTKPIALLFVGAAVALSGLIFFIWTLPQFGLTRAGIESKSADFLSQMIDLTPRLLMLIFIQVLAGFFLRQYRSSMEEQRFYESILRVRESQFLSYQIMKSIDGADLKEFAKSLLDMRDRELIRMQQGETTVVLEAQKLEANEFKGIPEMIFDFFKSVKSAGPDKKE